MKLRLLILAGIASVFFILPKVSLAEKIESFDSNITINTDASISVKETILYDFEAQQKHGIFRDITYKYKARGGNFNLKILDIAVNDEKGTALTFTTSGKGSDLEIKIGDANLFVSGQKTYIISYKVQRAINYFKDYDEIYWNSTGNNWQVPILKSSAKVVLPQGSQNIQIDCFSGTLGSDQHCSSSTTEGTKSASFIQENLSAGQGLTIVVGFSKNLVQKPSFWQNFLLILKDNWVLALPILTFIFLFYLWYTRGRDPKVSTVIAEYEPPYDLLPTEVGTILDEVVDKQDITSEIIQLCVQGYVKITKVEEKKLLVFNSTDYQLDLLKDKSILTGFQKVLIEGLFGKETSIKLSSLKNSFYKTIDNVKKLVYAGVFEKGFFVKNPDKIRKTYIGFGVLFIILGVVLGIFLQQFFYIIAFVLSGILTMVFSFFMPAKTAKGADAKAKILGLKLYLSIAEKDRLKFFNAPDKTPEKFEKLLPYAIALKVEDQWAKQFEGIYNNPPSWYNDSYGGNFNTLLFIGSLHHFNAYANTTLSSQPGRGAGASGGGSGFGGGGFSGGGFGGGGGGSW